MITRRLFTAGLFAPAIVQASNIMLIKPEKDLMLIFPTDTFGYYKKKFIASQHLGREIEKLLPGESFGWTVP